MKKKIVLLLITAGIAVFFFPPLRTTAQSGDSSFVIQRFEKKRQAPPFSLKSLDGNQVVLSNFKGKPIMLTFWATWCESCTDEMPVIEKISVGKREQLIILTVAIDGEKESRIQRFVKRKKITLPVLLDVKEKIARTYGVTMIPTTFFIDGEDFIIGMIRGERDWSSQDVWPAIRDLLSLR
jgi:peroxiredoxin